MKSERRRASALLIGVIAVAIAVICVNRYWRPNLKDRSNDRPKVLPPDRAEGEGVQKLTEPRKGSANAQLSVPHFDARRHEQLWHDFAFSENLLEYVQKEIASARAGDDEAQLFISRALGMCSVFEEKVLPKGSAYRAAAESAPPYSERYKQAIHSEKLCDPLAAANTDDVGTAEYWLKRAAEGGNGEAQFEIALNEDGQLSADDRVGYFHRALSSGNPYVVPLLVLYVGYDHLSGDEQIRSNPQLSTAAAALAQCEMGANCSSSSMTFLNNCATSRCDNAASVQEYYRLKLNSEEYGVAEQYANRLVQDLRSGRFDWPEAMQIEAVIKASHGLSRMSGGK